MNKVSIMFFAAALFASAAGAAPLAMDTQELRLQGGIDFNGRDGTEIGLEGGYGYFIADYLEVGGVLGFLDTENYSTYHFGGFAEYNFELIYEGIVPFVGGEVGFGQYDPDEGDGDSAMTFAAYTGVKFFITDSLAISPRLKVELATDEIYWEEDEMNDIDFTLDIGLRYFF